jgi:hypothetical protein
MPPSGGAADRRIKATLKIHHGLSLVVGNQLPVAGGEDDSTIRLATAGQESGVDEVMASHTESDEIVHVGRPAVEPRDDVVDLEVDAGAARVGAAEALLNEDRQPLLRRGEAFDPADVEDMAVGRRPAASVVSVNTTESVASQASRDSRSRPMWP